MVKRLAPSSILISIDKSHPETKSEPLERFQKGDEVNFNRVLINLIKDEDKLEAHFLDREDFFLKDIAAEAVNELEHLASEELDEIVKGQYKEMISLGPQLRLMDSLSFYQIKQPEYLSVNLDCVFNLDLAKPIFCTFCLCDENGIDFESIKCVTQLDPKSHISFIKYDDGDIEIPLEQATSINKIMFIIFQANYLEDEVELDQIGFSVLPLQYEEGFMHGSFQLPIFNEILLKNEYEILGRAQSWAILDKFTKKLGNNKQIKVVDTSIVVRVYPDVLKGLYEKENDPEGINTMFLPYGFPEEQLFTQEAIDDTKGDSRVKSVLPKDFDPEEIISSLLMYFQGITGNEVPGAPRTDDLEPVTPGEDDDEFGPTATEGDEEIGPTQTEGVTEGEEEFDEEET